MLRFKPLYPGTPHCFAAEWELDQVVLMAARVIQAWQQLC
jgi:hypothetical protein